MEHQPPRRAGQAVGIGALVVLAVVAIASLRPGSPERAPPPQTPPTVSPAAAPRQSAATTPDAAAAQADAVMRAHCRVEWPEDFEMQAFCLSKQRSAYRELQRG